MDEASSMRRREPLGDLAADPQGLGQRHAAHLRAVCAECVTVQALHDDVGQAALCAALTMLAHLMDRDHMGMLDGGGRPALADEPLT